MENPIEPEVEKEAGGLRPQIEIIRDYTAAQSEDSPVILVNPAHGNEPYILGTAIARGVSDRLAQKGLGRARIVVPLLYGDRQKQILVEENPDFAGLIHYDEEFGKILKDILFENGDFSSHLTQINNHYQDVEKMLRSRFAFGGNGFEARNLATSETQYFSPRNIVATIDTAARATIEVPNRYFAFPVLLSELLKEASSQGLGFSESEMKGVINKMLIVESQYSQVFIPKINTFSYKYADNLDLQPNEIDSRKRIYTPALKNESEKTSGKISEPGVYVMFSGTGSNEETNKQLVEASSEAGLMVYTPPWVDIDGSVQVSPEVLTDENIKAVFGRAGWGTGWQAQNLALPWIVNPYQLGDDPEIYFNNKTIEALRVGRVLSSAELNPKGLTEITNNFSTGISALNDRLRQEFGTLNGIDFVSDAITKDILAKSGKV